MAAFNNPFSDGGLDAIVQRLQERVADMPAKQVQPCICGGAGYTPRSVDGMWRWALCACKRECSSCLDGYTYDRDLEGYEWAHKCAECSGARQTVDMLNGAHLPQRHSALGATPRNDAQARLFKLLRAWCDKYTRNASGMTISGPAGVGKSFALVATLRALVERHKASVEYVHLPSMLRAQRQAMDDNDESADRRMSALVDACVLGIDELSDLRTDWQRETVSSLLSARYDAERTTLITTNLDEDQLLRIFSGDRLDGRNVHAGARIVSRLAQWAPVVTITGPDLRR